MNDKKLHDQIKDSMPETPYGFDTRVDAQVDSLRREGRGKVRRLNFRAVLVMAVIAVLALGTTIGFAMSTPVPGHVVIAAKLDSSAEVTDKVWYTDNTMGLVGLPVRDLFPGRTDKWYNVVPVDLTVKGRQTIRLVASNMYYIGEAYVDVTDTDVTVSYGTYRGNLEVKSECLAWFLDPAELTGAYMDAPQGMYAFGEPVSIKESLGGADVALLFICNRVTYCNPYNNKGESLIRYYPNLDQWKDWRASLAPLMDRLDEQLIRMRNQATVTDLATPTDEQAK